MLLPRLGTNSLKGLGLGPGVILLLVVGAILEVAANVVCYTVGMRNASDEILSLIAGTCLVIATLILVYEIGTSRTIRAMACVAVPLFVVSKMLNVTLAITAFNTYPLIGLDDPWSKILRDASFTIGVLLLLVIFIATALDAHRAHRELLFRNAALLRETEERKRLTTAIEQAAESVVITDRDGVIQYVNPAFEHLTGYPRQEAVGQTPRLVRSGRHDAAFYQRLWDTIASGHVWKGRFINRRKDGTLFEENATISCVRNDAGRIVSYVAIKRDVTAEVALERQLREAQKMEAIGALAGHIAHAFNNILSLILGHTELALRHLPEDDPVRIHVQHVAKAGNRAAHLVRQILTFSRRLEQDRRPIEIHPIVTEVIEFFRASLPPTIRISSQLDPQCGLVFADPTQIHQVVMNLCTNAFQAMDPQGGGLDVTLDTVNLPPGFPVDAGALSEGAYVRLRVSDTGSGMDETTRQRIFDPFFTTKAPGVGTGLGLSTVHGLVLSYNGGIAVKSAPGQGAVFDVYLPQFQGGGAEDERAPLPAPPGRENILFVDDDPEIVQMNQMLLEGLGYRVEPFTDGRLALDAFRAHPDAIDLVITDQVMPELTGLELAQALRAIRPDLPVILMSGFGHGVTAEHAKRCGIAEYLTKPVAGHALSSAIRRCLA